MEVGATASDTPTGYRGLDERRRLGEGRADFDEAVRRLMTWEMHCRTGLGIEIGGPVTQDQTAVLHLNAGPLFIEAPVRVVKLIDEASAQGFVYGTLEGHPERGEERFLVKIDDDSIVWGEIRAFSKPASWLTRLAGPIGRRVQSRITQRYLHALTVHKPAPTTTRFVGK